MHAGLSHAWVDRSGLRRSLPARIIISGAFIKIEWRGCVAFTIDQLSPTADCLHNCRQAHRPVYVVDVQCVQCTSIPIAAKVLTNLGGRLE